MAASSVETQPIAGRYAKALFDLAQEHNALDDVARDLETLTTALRENEDLMRMLSNPALSRETLADTANTLSAMIKAHTLTKNTLNLLATKRRLEILPTLIARFGDMMSEARGEVVAEVISAEPLSKQQLSSIEASLKKATGSKLNLKINENPSLLGGLIIKIGGKMLDYSLAGQLARMRTALTGTNK